MTITAYATVAQTRYRELKTRSAMAAFIGVTAWAIAPGVWPLAWFGAVLVSQGLDWAVFRRFRQKPEWEPDRRYLVVACVTTALSVAVYSAIAAYLWFAAGEVGRIFAMVQIAGGLLHVSLHMHQARPVLGSAVFPHATYFLALPVVSAATSGRWQDLLIAIGCVLYLSHLVVALRQTAKVTADLQCARDEARDAQRRAEVANAAKSDFLAVISHEIRTPMNAVISAANLLKRTRLDPPQAEHVEMLTDAGDVLMGLLNDVLDFSKIEAGKMTLEADDMMVRDRLAALHRLWADRARTNGVDLVLEVSPRTPEAIRADPLRLQQILFNLISNAVKFTREGRITVRADWADDELLVAVSDTGCGIPEDRLDKVFRSFEQAEAGTTRRYGGTGLGLTISRKLAEMMGGELTVQSRLGEGSTFTLRLPAPTACAVAAAAPRRETGEGLAGLEILAADDHEVNRRILALLLEPHGCRLSFAENGREAVTAASERRFDVILMDMQMPVMDGVEATGRIRATGQNRMTPVIALTANAMDVHRAAWDRVGVQAFLTKPIDPALLAQTLLDACQTEPEAVSEVA